MVVRCVRETLKIQRKNYHLYIYTLKNAQPNQVEMREKDGEDGWKKTQKKKKKMMMRIQVWSLLLLLVSTRSTPLSHISSKTLQQRFSTVPVAPSTVALDNLQIASTNSLDMYVFLTHTLSLLFLLTNNHNRAMRECMDVPFSVCVGAGKPVVPPARAKSLVGHWKFDDLVGHDSSGLGNGMLPFPQVGPARGGVGASAYFNGTNYGYVGHIGAFESSDMTLAFWVYLLQDATGQFRYLIQKGDANEFTPTLSLWDKNNRLHLKVTTESGTVESLDSSARLSVGRWSHVAVVIQGSLVQLYVNGIMDAQLISGGGNVQFNRMPLYVGRGPTHSGTACYLDDLRIHRSAVQASVIQSLSQGSLGSVSPSFTRLGCMNCTRDKADSACAMFNMHGGYSLCSERDLLSGAVTTARAMGWLQRRSLLFWSSDDSDTFDLAADRTADPKETRLGLCCKK